MIKIKNLFYKNILSNINIELEKGIIYIKGENGSGKTTFLDCISKLNTSYEGEVVTNDSIIYLNQNVYFSYRLKSKDFIEFVLTLDKINNYEEAFFKYISPFSQDAMFKKIWHTPVGKLSGGERTKLFFSAFTCLDREWYIFDEPFAGIDDAGKTFMIDIIKALASKGKGIIITSHETEPLLKLENVRTLEVKNGNVRDLVCN